MQAEKWRKKLFCLQVGLHFDLSANKNITRDAEREDNFSPAVLHFASISRTSSIGIASIRPCSSTRSGSTAAGENYWLEERQTSHPATLKMRQTFHPATLKKGTNGQAMVKQLLRQALSKKVNSRVFMPVSSPFYRVSVATMQASVWGSERSRTLLFTALRCCAIAVHSIPTP